MPVHTRPVPQDKYSVKASLLYQMLGSLEGRRRTLNPEIRDRNWRKVEGDEPNFLGHFFDKKKKKKKILTFNVYYF